MENGQVELLRISMGQKLLPQSFHTTGSQTRAAQHTLGLGTPATLQKKVASWPSVSLKSLSWETMIGGITSPL